MMRKHLRKLAGVLLALVMAVSLLPVTASASPSSIWVGGVELASGEYLATGATEATATAPADNYAYYKDGVLTLKNYEYSGSGHEVSDSWYAVYSDGELEIHLVGNNEIAVAGNASSYYAAVHVTADLSITAEDNAAWYITSEDGDGIYSYGDVTINGGYIYIDAYEDGIDAGSLFVNGGEVGIYAPYCVWLYDEVVLGDGMAAYPYTYLSEETDSYYPVPATTYEMNYCDSLWFTEAAPIYVGGVELEDGEWLAEGSATASTAALSDNYAHYENGVLTLKNYDYAGTGRRSVDKDDTYYDVIYADTNLWIQLAGTSTLLNTADANGSICSGINALWDLCITAETGGGMFVAAGDIGISCDAWATMYSGAVIAAGDEVGTYTNYFMTRGGAYVSGGGMCGIDTFALVAGGGQLAATSLNDGGVGLSADKLVVYNDYRYSLGNDSENLSDVTEVEYDDFAETCGNYKVAFMEKVGAAVRIAGSSRYDTAFMTADAIKSSRGNNDFYGVIVTSGENFADALAGSYLSSYYNFPILLTDNDNMDDVMDYIRENVVEDGIVCALGGPSIVSDELFELEDEGFTVERLAGASRFETNLAILDAVGIHEDIPVLVCTAYNFADSLSASTTGLPILLVDDTVSEAQLSFLQERGVHKFVLVGGTGAVSTAVENQLKALGAVERLAGANRFETSTMLADWCYGGSMPESIVMAYGYNFPDGLCAGLLGYEMGAPLILTANGDETQAALYAGTLGVTQGVVLGGPSLINDEAVRTILSLHEDDEVVSFSNMSAMVMALGRR